MIAVLVLGAAGLGFVLGRATAPMPEAGPNASTASPTGPTDAGTDGQRVLADPESLEGMRAMAEHAIEWGADPNALVSGAMDQMSDEQLITLVTSLTDYGREELEGVHDMRAFVSRLAAIAMDGTLAPSEDLPPGLAHVEFATEVGPDNSASNPTNHFRADAARIYAVFASEELGGEEIFAKWVRVEDGEVLLFGRYQIEPGDDHSYVWMARPDQSWVPGSYRVDFYTSDESLDLLASGSHTVSP
jgi:hypothetical protein